MCFLEKAVLSNMWFYPHSTVIVAYHTVVCVQSQQSAWEGNVTSEAYPPLVLFLKTLVFCTKKATQIQKRLLVIEVVSVLTIVLIDLI